VSCECVIIDVHLKIKSILIDKISEKNMKVNRKIIAVILIIAAVLSVAFFSNQNTDVSNQLSSSLALSFRDVAVDIGIVASRSTYGSMSAFELNLAVRDIAHATLYGIFALVVFWGVRHWLKRIWISVPITLVITLAMALFDEYNQAFTMGRTSSITDVYLDMSGAVIGIGFTLLLSLMKHLILYFRDSKE
jgi:VanZ family protein